MQKIITKIIDNGDVIQIFSCKNLTIKTVRSEKHQFDAWLFIRDSSLLITFYPICRWSKLLFLSRNDRDFMLNLFTMQIVFIK